MKVNHTLKFYLLFLLAILISIISCLFADSVVLTIVSTVSTLIGIFGLLISFKLDRNISEASFLFDLYTKFNSDVKIGKIYTKLEDVFLDKQADITEDDRESIIAYLTFFEILASMEHRGVISIDCFDPLFGYNFFIAYNNENVRKIELDKFKEYYTQIHYLAPRWEKYRRKKKLPIPLSE